MDNVAHIMLLLAGISALGRPEATSLWVCENEDVTFSNAFVPDRYEWITWSFRMNDHVDDTTIKEIPNDHNLTIPEKFAGRFNRIEETIGFTLSDAKMSDSGIFACVVQFQNGSKKVPIWILTVQNATELIPPNITKNHSDSNCTTYTCHDNNTNVTVDTYWIYQGKVKFTGDTLKLCEDNSSEIITCVIETNCSFSYKALDTTEDCIGDVHDCIGDVHGESNGGCLDIVIGFGVVILMVVIVFTGITLYNKGLCIYIGLGKMKMKRDNSLVIEPMDDRKTDVADAEDDGSGQHGVQGDYKEMRGKKLDYKRTNGFRYDQGWNRYLSENRQVLEVLEVLD